eukprot:COSAG02_NODE_20_length_53673_cov_86.864841_3_plen_55_part_00
MERLVLPVLLPVSTIVVLILQYGDSTLTHNIYVQLSGKLCTVVVVRSRMPVYTQ